ncbi:hypothetical protein R1sor_025153 [Riccia sorocarpa]|uniref:Protein kinase domain-containing protein n=1 Tax=Riccia sorocarpa TaxID=122646 RepID=A0ABD3GB21_9MARC
MSRGIPDFVRVKVLDRREDLENHYILTNDSLGEGMFGTTCVARCVSDPSQRVAVKTQQRVDPINGIFEEEVLRLYKEILFLNRILPRHPNILELKDVLVSPAECFYVTELCEGKMEDFYPVCDEESARRAFSQLVEAVHVCHQHGVLHNDIKVDNILFSDRNFMQVKLIDFGVAEYDPQWAVRRNRDFDYLQWFNPEEIWGIGLNPKVDIRALGFILHEMIVGQSIYEVTSFIVQTDQRPRTDMFSSAALHLLSQIGMKPYGPEDQDLAFTLDQIREHPWLTGLPFINIQPTMNLQEELRLLQNDLTVLKRLLRSWMIPPVIVQIDMNAVMMEYEALGWLYRGHEQTRLYLIRSKANNQIQRHCKLVNCTRGLYVQHMARLSHENFEPEKHLTPQLLELMASEADPQDDITDLGKILYAMMCRRWEEDPAESPESYRTDLLPVEDEFHPLAFDLLGMIGPEPFGAPQRYRTISIDEICEHPWLLLP